MTNDGAPSRTPGPVDVLLGGFLQDPSGAGLIHSELGRGLMSDQLATQLSFATMPLYRTVPPVWQRLGARLPPSDALVWTSTPLPLRIPRDLPLFPIIYDVRWVTTRSGASRLYRSLDLARTLRRARAVFTISDVVAAQLSLLTSKPIHVLPLGPGQFEGRPLVEPADTRTIVLLGGAPHKRNEDAARLIVGTPAVATRYRVIAVDVSAECAAILREGMPEGSCSIRARVSRAELAEILTQASVFLALGIAEGFGFPYIESRYFGCHVVAPNVPITREVLGSDSPGLLDSVDGDALLEALDAWDREQIRREQREVAQRSWLQSCQVLLDALERYC